MVVVERGRLASELAGRCGDVLGVGAGHIQRRLQGVSPQVLTRTKRQLEQFGFLTRTVIPAVPVQVTYALTDLGRGAAEPLAALRTWVEANMDSVRFVEAPV